MANSRIKKLAVVSSYAILAFLILLAVVVIALGDS